MSSVYLVTIEADEDEDYRFLRAEQVVKSVLKQRLLEHNKVTSAYGRMLITQNLLDIGIWSYPTECLISIDG